jgi:hypothetical protein
VSLGTSADDESLPGDDDASEEGGAAATETLRKWKRKRRQTMSVLSDAVKESALPEMYPRL